MRLILAQSRMVYMGDTTVREQPALAVDVGIKNVLVDGIYGRH